MNIGICLDRNDFMYDIHSLVKSFFPDDEVHIYTKDDPVRQACRRDLVLNVEIPEYTDRKNAKDSLKRDLYQQLSDFTEKQLPWGTLSGIRPTKIPMKMLSDGCSREEILRHLQDDYFVSPERAELALSVAENEKKILRRIPLSEDSWSLYIHVPFCPSICLYCTFSSSPISTWARRADEYIETVIREMQRKKTALLKDSGSIAPTTVYIGGGTPTSLSEEQLDRLLTAVRHVWDLSGCLEYTVEAGRPDSLTEEKLAVLMRHGVTRISVNPQTMNDETLERIGRKHTSADVLRAFYMAREAGFDNINMDMILGLPGEDARHVSRTLGILEELKPDSLTVHSLAIKRASALRKAIREDRETDINADYGNFGGLIFENSEELMDMAAGTAAAMGMRPYYLYRQKNMRGNLENTGFSVPGRECLYNILIMEELQSIYAFGAGASTKYVYPDGRIERTVSPKDVKTYLERQRDISAEKSAEEERTDGPDC